MSLIPQLPNEIILSIMRVEHVRKALEFNRKKITDALKEHIEKQYRETDDDIDDIDDEDYTRINDWSSFSMWIEATETEQFGGHPPYFYLYEKGHNSVVETPHLWGVKVKTHRLRGWRAMTRVKPLCVEGGLWGHAYPDEEEWYCNGDRY